MTYYDNYGNRHELIETYVSNPSHLDTNELQKKLVTAMYNAKEGHFLTYKDGRLTWVKLPPQFKDYLDKL